jgi:leucyl-tRNA synthetase
MLNELVRITNIVNQAYIEMKFKIVIKHAFNELGSLKESYLIAKAGKPNPVILFNYLETLLLLLNPIIPHFC